MLANGQNKNKLLKLLLCFLDHTLWTDPTIQTAGMELAAMILKQANENYL